MRAGRFALLQSFGSKLPTQAAPLLDDGHLFEDFVAGLGLAGFLATTLAPLDQLDLLQLFALGLSIHGPAGSLLEAALGRSSGLSPI